LRTGRVPVVVELIGEQSAQGCGDVIHRKSTFCPQSRR
jgi:hypothetical protein